MCMHATEPCRGRRTVLWRFSPPILLEVPGIGLRSPCLCSKYSYSLSHCAGPLSAPVSLSCLLKSVLYSTVLKCNQIALPLKSILPVGAQPRTALDHSKVCTFDSGLASSSSRVLKSSSSGTTHLILAEFLSPLFYPSALAQEMTLLHHPRHLLNTC